MKRNRILCVSFSPLQSDSRVLRQVRVLQEFGDVVTVGYGPPPLPEVEHIEVPDGAPSLPRSLQGVIQLALRHYTEASPRTPGADAVVDRIRDSGPYDLIVANDARALPLAFSVADSAPVWADMHEWAPEENSTNLIWKALVRPYMDWLCRHYLPRCVVVTTVSDSISDLYAQTYGVHPTVIRNTGPFRDLRPTATCDDSIRLVHSGAALKNRNLENLILAVRELDQRFSLDLYLIDTEGNVGKLKRLAGSDKRVRFHEPVPPGSLPSELNKYDLGVFLLPPRTVNYEYMLPNKMFDYVQARLGVVFGPAVETDRIINEFNLGVITSGWGAADLRKSLEGLTTRQVAEHKLASHQAAHALSNEADLEAQRESLRKILGTKGV